jgi:hypothetical protein
VCCTYVLYIRTKYSTYDVRTVNRSVGAVHEVLEGGGAPANLLWSHMYVALVGLSTQILNLENDSQRQE